MATDYSRFYLVGGKLTGFQLYCLDCDEDDLVPFDDSDADPLDLGQMVRAADRHVAERHPVKAPTPPLAGQMLTASDPEPPLGTIVQVEAGKERWIRMRDYWVPVDRAGGPERWRKIAGTYGPVTVRVWGWTEEQRG